MGKRYKYKRKRRFSHDWGVPVAKRKGPSDLALIAIGLSLGGAVGCGVIFRPVPPSVDGPTTAQANRNVTFGFCHVGGGQNCVVDGDTFWVEGIKVRIMDIDAPETHPPRCAYEADLGDRATNRLHELLNDGPFRLESGARDVDRYGRKLRVVTRNGETLGGILVNEGLAREWIGSRQPWC